MNHSFADDRSNGRSTSMAFANMVSATGTDAYGLNPANYDYYSPIKLTKTTSSSKHLPVLNKPRWEFSVMNIGGGYGSDSSIEFYNNYLSYLTIDRNKFVNLFTDLTAVLEFRNNVLPNKKTEVNYDFELKWFSVNFSYSKFGALNFTFTDRVGLNTNVNSRDEYLPLTFGVNYNAGTGKTDLTDVNLAQSEAIAWWIRKYNIGYAKKFNYKSGSFAIGAGVSLVHGFGNVSTYETKLNISTWGIKSNNGINHVDSVKGKQDFHTQSALTDFFRDYKDGHESKYNLFPTPAGVGYSFDFGITMEIGKEWKIAASVIDLGKISWDYNTITNDDTNHFAYYNFNMTGTDPTYNALVDDLGGYKTQDTGLVFKTDMPTKFRAGIVFKPSAKFMLELNWSKGTNNLPGNTDQNVLALGSEIFPVYFLPLRLGVSIGGPGDFFISLGAGIKFKNFTLDLGTHGINQLILDKRFSVAVSSSVIF